MKKHLNIYISGAIFSLNFLLVVSSVAFAGLPPDFKVVGAIAALKADVKYSSSPYNETYNLGATGLRGWIYDGGEHPDAEILSLTTDLSRQILITAASAPGSAVLAVDDVILGAMAGSTGTVPDFTSDSRKAIGAAISDAEETGAGTLRIKRWRAGTATDVNITMAIMGNYTATAPYNCPKSTQILANARTKLVAGLLANPRFLSLEGDRFSGAITGLALMAGVVPGDADYATVQTRLKSYAQALTPSDLTLDGCNTWNWSYVNIFLSEYYLRSVEGGSPDAGVLAGINKYTVAMAKGQSRYGTFGPGRSSLTADGKLHGSVPPYGALNSAGLAANLSIVLGKKALLAGFQTLDSEIDPAIERGSKFFKYYVNKGGIPYGENVPTVDSHAFNGKVQMGAVFFALQGNRPVETEYFSRLATAAYLGREAGHNGTGFNYLWEAMGANVGGPTAVAKYLEKIRWNFDLERRTDGSFVYDGSQKTDGGGSTKDGTYLGQSDWNQLNLTASYVLTYSLPLQRLYITGKNANSAITLDAAKVANAIAAGSYKLDCPSYSNTRLIADLSQFDPMVREDAAIQLGSRAATITTGEVNTLIAMVNSPSANERMGVCLAVGLLKIPAALPLLSQRLSDPDPWVRAKAANGLRKFRPEDFKSELTPMLNAFLANATDPEVIAWEDPIQIANTFLSAALFGDPINGTGFQNISSYTLTVPKELLHPAVRVGLKQPYSYPRHGVSTFTYNLTLADAQALTPELFATATIPAMGGTMWHGEARGGAITALAKFKAAEAIPLAVAMQQVIPEFGWGSHEHQIEALKALRTFGDAARWTLPVLRAQALALDPGSPTFVPLTDAITSIDAATTSPTGINNLMAVAHPQMVVTSGPKAMTLTGSSCRSTTVTFFDVTEPAHGTLTGSAPDLIYTPDANYIGPDFVTFKTKDALTTSAASTVSIIVGVAGTGLRGEYFDNPDFTNLKLTRTDPEVNFDWGTGSPSTLVGGDTFSVRWSGQLLVPETGEYTFSTLNSDGVRLFINGVSLIDDYVDQSTGWQDSVPISLTAGQKVDIQMEYYENTGSAVAKLKWTGPSLAGLNGLPIAKEWLYDGRDLTTRTAYANAQSISLVQNVAQAITLTSGGATQATVTYTIVNKPTNGILTGTEPYLTYTPDDDYSGPDSFTFTVDNGGGESAPATVSIGILAGQPNSYFWTSGVTGNWSSSSWSNATGGSVTPIQAGSSTYSLNFNQPGTYITTQNLNNNYLFNQLNVTGAVTFAGTNSISPTANGSLLPQINQNSGNSVTFSAPVHLASGTTFGGKGAGLMTISSVISGAGGLTKASPGTLEITNTNNTYSGGTIINLGVLSLDYRKNQGLGTGPVILNPNGTLRLNYVNANNALVLNGGTIAAYNGFGNSFSGPVTLNSRSTITGPDPLTFNGVISGSGGFNKTGTNTLVLSGSNTFTGANSISAGILECNSAAALGSGPIDITSGAKVKLNFTGTRVIDALSYNGGAPLVAGTYGSTTSPATNQNNTYFSGSGTITILPASTITLNLSTGSNPSIFGTTLTFTATVTGPAPSGNVMFYNGATLLGSSALDGSFKARFTISSLAAGSHSIIGKFTGSPNHAPSTSAVLNIGVNSSVPAVPSQLAATSLVNWVGLTWSASNGATAYQVKRSLTSGGPYTIIATISGTSYTDTEIIAGTSYEYVVSAVTGTGNSTNSAAVSATPIIPSPAKNILTFVFPGLPLPTISGTNISVTMPLGTNVTTLAPIYTLSADASCNPLSGTPRDFTSVQNYTITAEDSSTKIYTVRVTVEVAPFAFSQNVTTSEDVTKSITLVATDGNSDVLTFVILTKPVYGTLEGELPNLTYAPNSNYNGADSFTFKANDSKFDSAPATVSLTVTAVNDSPVALAKNVVVGVNTAKPITLVATDVETNTLDYVIVTAPVNGRLSGDIPNLTFTPNENYSGADSFTFKANDGLIDSATATVSISVTPLTFTWNTAIPGNWSDGSKWTIGTSPNSVGIEGCELNFNTPGTYTATHNLSAGFLLNRLNFGGSTVALVGNGLTLAANGGNSPQVNQNSASAVTVSTPLGLTASTTLGGNGTGALTLSGLISGSGSLSKTTSGNLTLSGVNTYTGGTTVSSGILSLENINGLGTGPLTMVAGTTFQQLGFEGNGPSGAVPNAVVLNGTGNVIIKMSFGGSKDIWLSQPISGTGGFTVEGAGRSLTLAANNTFSGGVKLPDGGNNSIKFAHNNALGSGIFRTERTTAASGGLVSVANLSALPGVANAFEIASGAYLNVFANGTNDLLLSGSITSANGIGHLHKSGSATLTLAGVNTYTGSTTVAAGMLACNSATALGQGPVVINGGKLDLNYPGTRQVASLSLGGVLQANGSYGSSTSPATFVNNTYFSGVGTVIVGPINTTTTVTSNLNPATVGAAVTFTATVTGRTPTGNISFYAGNTLLGTGTLNSSFQASITTSSLAIGGSSITASYAGSTNNSASSSLPLNQQVTASPYDTWASHSAQGMAAGVKRGAMDDPDKDGIPNLIEFVLGGAPMLSSQAPLPTLKKSANQLVFTYNRSKAAQNSISQTVEYGNNLVGWTPVIITPFSSGSVVITAGELSDRVTVTVPNEGRQTFIRLKVTK